MINLNAIGLLLLKKKHQIVSIERDRPFLLKFCTKNGLFLRPQLFLKSKTITNQERIGCLVYAEITQISERSFKYMDSGHVTGSGRYKYKRIWNFLKEMKNKIIGFIMGKILNIILGTKLIFSYTLNN